MTQNPYQAAGLRYYAQAHVYAASVDPASPEDVRVAMDHVFAARGCVARDVNDFVQQHGLIEEIDASLSTTEEERQAWSAVLAADRGNNRMAKASAVDICPFPLPSARITVMNFDPWRGVQLKPKAAAAATASLDPAAVGTPPAETSLGASMTTKVQTFVASLGLVPRELKTLSYYANAQVDLLVDFLQDRQLVMQTWYANRFSEACLSRDIPDQKHARDLADRVTNFLASDPELAETFNKARGALKLIDPDPETIRPIVCPLPAQG